MLFQVDPKSPEEVTSILLALLGGVGLAGGRFVLFSRQFLRSPNG